MFKKIIVFSITALIALLLVCSNNTGNRSNPDKPADSPADNPHGDDPATDIKLESLAVSYGNLVPVFDPDVFSYDVKLTPEITELNITAQPPPDCYAEINDKLLTHDSCSVIVPINGNLTSLSISTGDNVRDGEIYNLKIIRMEEKIIENHSFEFIDDKNHPSGWELAGTGEFISVNEFSRSGNFSGAFTTLTGSISGREIRSRPVEIEQSKSIIASSWFYVPYIEGSTTERISVSLKIYFYTDAGCLTPASTEYATMTKTFLKEQGVWEKIIYERGIDVIPDETRFVRIAVRACYNSVSGGTKNDRVYFDDISLQQ